MARAVAALGVNKKKRSKRQSTERNRARRPACLTAYLPNDRLTPFELIRPKRNVSEHEVNAIPPQTLRVLLDAAIAAKNHEAALYFSMGFFTGMRTSELQRLQWDHFFTERNIIILPAAVTKNNRTRQVPIHPVLKAWLDFLGTHAQREGVFKQHDDSAVHRFCQTLDAAETRSGQGRASTRLVGKLHARQLCKL